MLGNIHTLRNPERGGETPKDYCNYIIQNVFNNYAIFEGGGGRQPKYYRFQGGEKGLRTPKMD